MGSNEMRPLYRLGVDVGGTFTDLLLLEEASGETWRAKVPSTPEDQSVGVLYGVEQVLAKVPQGADLDLTVVNHGTTVATNAILEQKGAKVALVVTEGYRDILQTRRSQVPGGLASWITWEKPEPLAPLELTVEAPGRIATNGDEVHKFNAEVFTERLRRIERLRPDAITVSLLNSFANPKHEQAVRNVLLKVFPDTPISLSSEVLPELMEYERTVTTVANSYVEPKVNAYLLNLLASLQSKAKNLRILRSDGGLSSVKLANKFPVTLALSGPAGGVTGVVSAVADRTKFKNLITFDMGGTSTDVALIEDGAARIRRETKIADLVVKAPSIDVRSVGAGGGSIARVPEVTKALRVGPESAGAVPGPAAYNKGGEQATVTDANVVMGYLPAYLLGGTMKLDVEASKRAVQKVADDMGVDIYEAAQGILEVSNETMYGALRLVSVEQGYDPRNFSLVAFGGAGPLHGNALGKLLGAWPVIIPPSPGVLCAWGDATTVLRHESAMTFIRLLGVTQTEEIIEGYTMLLQQAKDVMRESQGVPSGRQLYKYQADLRYMGQAITVPVEMEMEALERKGLGHMKEAFELAHEKLFTYRLDSDVELMNLRVVAEEHKPMLKVKTLAKATSRTPPLTAISGRTNMVYAGAEFRDSPVYERAELRYGHILQGPCVVTEMDSNTVILPGFHGEIDHVGNILIFQDKHSQVRELEATNGVNPVVVDIFENALRNARNEMDTLMTHATMSPAIREQQDEFNVIAEPGGKMLVGQFGSFIKHFLGMWKGTVEPDDIFITNDPYSVGGAISHLNDWLVMMPVFVEGKLIAWVSNFGHQTDNGGSVPGSLPTSASSIFEEGIQIPTTKLASRGRFNQPLVEVLYRNCRLPEWSRCDTLALVAACKLASKRMIELYRRFGDRVYFEAIDELLDRNKRAIASLIETAIPPDPVYFEDYLDDDGKGIGPWKVACTMTKENGKVKFDFTGTDPQSSSSVNYYLNGNMFKMFFGTYLITVYDRNTVVNDGFHDLVDFYVPPGTILNPIRPAALSTRTHLLGRVMDLLSGLLGQKAPEFMTAGGFSDSPHFMYSGWRANGTWFQLYQIGFGGIPARPHGDGMDGHCLWPAMKSVPNEFLELYYPLRIEQYNTVTDSGGPGYFRGGNAQRVHYRFLEEGEISIHDDRWLSKPWGVLGGEPGARSRKTLVHYSENADKPRREVLGSKVDHIHVRSGDLLEWLTWGGGGYGDPLTRDPAIVALECHRGLVSIAGARRYGVIVDPEEFSVDLPATEQLRAEIKAARTPETDPTRQIFNRGFTHWEDLKKTALEETGQVAPKWPWEVPMRGPHTGLPYVKEWLERHGVGHSKANGHASNGGGSERPAKRQRIEKRGGRTVAR